MRGIKVPHPSLLRMPIWLHSEIIYTASRIFGPRRDQLQFTIYSMTLYPGRSVLLHSYLIFPLNTEWLQKVHYITVSHLNDTELFYICTISPLLIHFYNEWILVCYSDCLATASWVSTIPSSWPRRRLPTATTPSPTTWRRTSASPRAPTSSRVSNSGIRYVALFLIQQGGPTEFYSRNWRFLHVVWWISFYF